MADMGYKAAAFPRPSNRVQPETALTQVKLWGLGPATLREAHGITSSKLGGLAGISVFGLPLLGMNRPNAELGEVLSSTVKRGDGTTLTFSILIPDAHRRRVNADIAVYDFEMILKGNEMIFVPKDAEGAVKVGALHSGKLGLPEDIAIDFWRDVPRADVPVPRIVVPTIGCKQGATYYNVVYAGAMPNAPHGVIPTGSRENVLKYLSALGELVGDVLFKDLHGLIAEVATDPIMKLMNAMNIITGKATSDRPINNLGERTAAAEEAVVYLLSTNEVWVSERNLGVLTDYVIVVKLNLPVIEAANW